MGLEKWRAKELLFKYKIVMHVLNDVAFYVGMAIGRGAGRGRMMESSSPPRPA